MVFEYDFFNKKKLFRDIDDYYIISEEIIGNGISGNIVSCYSKKTYKKYALKKIKKNKSSFNEINILYYLQKNKVMNIIGIKDVFLIDKMFYVILEYADKGDLFDILQYKKLNELKILSIIYNISNILKGVHVNNIIHGDIKLENILILNNKLYLTDFGFSVFGDKNIVKRCSYTLPYTAPEQLESNIFVFKSDVWSLGMIMFYLFYNEFPFDYNNHIEDIDVMIDLFKREIKFPSIPDATNDFKQIVSNTLKYNIEDRISLQDLINSIEKIIHLL